MSKIYFTSDLHFNHSKDFIYEPRGFANVDQMNEAIILRHNSVVTPEDEVYILGDLCLGGTNALEHNKRLIERLNGNLHIILGNHDSLPRIQMYWDLRNIAEFPVYAATLKYAGYNFYLSHYPTLTANYDDDKPLKKKVINLCGHSHTKDKFSDMDKGIIYHVEQDAHDCYPVLLDDIIEDIRRYK
jgi:calcineurin-like phosphoesterase family protein